MVASDTVEAARALLATLGAGRTGILHLASLHLSFRELDRVNQALCADVEEIDLPLASMARSLEVARGRLARPMPEHTDDDRTPVDAGVPLDGGRGSGPSRLQRALARTEGVRRVPGPPRADRVDWVERRAVQPAAEAVAAEAPELAAEAPADPPELVLAAPAPEPPAVVAPAEPEPEPAPIEVAAPPEPESAPEPAPAAMEAAAPAADEPEADLELVPLGDDAEALGAMEADVDHEHTLTAQLSFAALPEAPPEPAPAPVAAPAPAPRAAPAPRLAALNTDADEADDLPPPVRAVAPVGVRAAGPSAGEDSLAAGSGDDDEDVGGVGVATASGGLRLGRPAPPPSGRRSAPSTEAPQLTDEPEESPSATQPQIAHILPAGEDGRVARLMDDAVVAAGRGDIVKAIQAFTDVLDLRHDRSDAHIGRGRCYLELGDYSSAMSDFQRAEDLHPNRPDPHVAMGDLYFARKEYRRAIEFYDQAVELDGSHAMARCRRGISHYYRKNFRQAFQDLQRAYSLDPEIPNIRKYVQMAVKKLERGD